MLGSHKKGQPNAGADRLRGRLATPVFVLVTARTLRPRKTPSAGAPCKLLALASAAAPCKTRHSYARENLGTVHRSLNS